MNGSPATYSRIVIPDKNDLLICEKGQSCAKLPPGALGEQTQHKSKPCHQKTLSPGGSSAGIPERVMTLLNPNFAVAKFLRSSDEKLAFPVFRIGSPGVIFFNYLEEAILIFVHF